MPGHAGGTTHKVSQDLYNLKRQLKSGRTRGLNPRELGAGDRLRLESRCKVMETQLAVLAERRAKEKEERDANQRRLIIDGVAAKVDASTTAVNAHTTSTVTASEPVVAELFKSEFKELISEMEVHTRPQLTQVGLMGELMR